MTDKSKNKPGKVYLVGAGPGDAELLTMKAARLLAECDAVLYDYLAPREILDLAPAQAERIYVGKQGSEHTLPQDRINSLLVELARRGKKVVRLKGGDPFIFGRGGEEAEVLAGAGVEFEFVPGVSSAIAAPAYAGIPLTHRRFTSSVVILTGHEDQSKPFSAINWESVATGSNTLVILMGMKKLRENMGRLIAGGLDPETPVACVRWGASPKQQTVTGTVANIADEAERAKLRAPAVIVVGRVVNFRNRLKWFETRPLFGRKILVTRARTHAAQLAGPLRDAGAEVFETPTIEIVGQIDHPEVESAIERIGEYDWVVLTSVNGVRYFFEALDARGLDARSLGGVRLAAIGPATADALRDRGFRTDVVPEEFSAEGLLEALVGAHGRAPLRGKKVLLARAEDAREVLPEKLVEMGAEVTVAPIYTSRIPARGADRLKELLANNVGAQLAAPASGRASSAPTFKKPDMITFASSSTVRNFMKMARGLDLEGIGIACIGPITAETAREMGLEVQVQPDEYTIPALVQAIIEYYSSK